MSRTIASPIPFNGVHPDDMERNLPAMGFHRVPMDFKDDLSAEPQRVIYSRRAVRDDPEDPPKTTSTVVSNKKKRPEGDDRPKNLPAGKPPAAAPALKKPEKTKPPSDDDRPKNLPKPDPPAATPALKKPEKTKPPSEDDRPKNLPKPDPPAATPTLKKPEKTKPPSDDDRPKNLPKPDPPTTSPAFKKPEKTKPPSEDDRPKILPKSDPPTTSPAVKKPEETKPPSEDDRPKTLPGNSGTPPATGITELPVFPELQSPQPEPEMPLKPDPPAQDAISEDTQTSNTPGTSGRKDEEEDVLPEPVVIPAVPAPSAAPGAPAGHETPETGTNPEAIPGNGISGGLGAEPSAGMSPPLSPYGGNGGPTSEQAQSFGAEQGTNSLSVQTGKPESDFLTSVKAGDFNDEQLNMEARPGLLSTIGNFFRDLFDAVFKSGDSGGSSEVSYIPAAYSGRPPVDNDLVESFRAGYISQRDLETALGREDWTMCCATTFIYAIQTRYPGLTREEIIEAAGKAAKTELADGSGPCVSDDGYVASIHQYSQALSRELGLEDYVDTPGSYPSVEAAEAAGVTMMKVKLSGTVDHEKVEHHVLLQSGIEIDPIGKDGIDKLLDDGSKQVESVMALNWYELP